jgi:hypothetical protein
MQQNGSVKCPTGDMLCEVSWPADVPYPHNALVDPDSQEAYPATAVESPLLHGIDE